MYKKSTTAIFTGKQQQNATSWNELGNGKLAKGFDKHLGIITIRKKTTFFITQGSASCTTLYTPTFIAKNLKFVFCIVVFFTAKYKIHHIPNNTNAQHRPDYRPGSIYILNLFRISLCLHSFFQGSLLITCKIQITFIILAYQIHSKQF